MGAPAGIGAAAPKKGFKVTVRGEYYALAADMRRKTPMPYEIDVILPSMDSALSIIKNKLLAKALRYRYKDFQDFRTHEIINVVDLSGQTTEGLIPSYMNKQQLVRYVKAEKLPVDVEAYIQLEDFRKAIHLAETNPKEFIIFQDNAKKNAKIERELNELNPELNNAPAPSAEVKADKPSGQRPSASPPADSPGETTASPSATDAPAGTVAADEL